VKRLRDGTQSPEAFLRFADEVRMVGQLEHPAIVPVYDVGRDESGQVYLVMKHLDGVTMDHVIERLQARDPEFVAKYPLEHRLQLFLAILDAIRYAHSRGVIHRDLKPANIMIGHFGEVTVLDWGIAKPIRRAAAAEKVDPLERTFHDSVDRRLQETHLGSLAGTPLYMSPEQAAGRNDQLDERSDVYALSVLLYEWLSLIHPLEGKKTVTEVLAATIAGLDVDELGGRALFSGVPAEWARILMRGLRRDREARYQSVEDLEREIQRVLEGRVRIQCHVTLTKRVTSEAMHWIDRHPKVYLVMFGLSTLGALSGLIYALYRVVRLVV
jgi:serine/threonine-protein kinase